MGDTEAEDSLGKRLEGGRLAYERAIRRSSLPPGARHVALTVATWANIESGVIPDRFQPSLSTIAEATGLAKSSVKRQLSVLEDEGWLGRVRPEGDKARTEHARTAYRLTIPTEAGPTVGLGPGWAMPEPTVGQDLGPQSAKARPTVGHKSPSSSSSSSLSARLPQQTRDSPTAPKDEREINSHDQDGRTVAAAWSAIHGVPNPIAEKGIAAEANQLLAAGWTVSDTVSLAEHLARTYPTGTRLSPHIPHWQASRCGTRPTVAAYKAPTF